MKTITAEVNLSKLNPSSPVPFVVQKRLAFESKGIRFSDSGKLSSIANLNPKIVGTHRIYTKPRNPHVVVIIQELPEVE